MKRAFTIIELLLAIGLMVVLLAVSGEVFQMAITSYRTAAATGEIARKLTAITYQLNSDFQGLRKDGEIFCAWVPKPTYDGGAVQSCERFDRIMFFADGDFQSYREWPGVLPASWPQHTGPVRGNTARLTYMLAKGAGGIQPQVQSPRERVLVRSQHIITAEEALVDQAGPPYRARVFPIDPAAPATSFGDPSIREYENLALDEWLNIPWSDKREILTVITDIRVGGSNRAGGLAFDRQAPDPSVHQLLCEGVGHFEVQGWYEPQKRWFPAIDPDGNGTLGDSDFFLNGSVIDEGNVPGLLYPYVGHLMEIDPDDMHGYLAAGSESAAAGYPREEIDAAHFRAIPGLGRALKFTFTLYDSRGVFKDGKTFTHIVYLDD